MLISNSLVLSEMINDAPKQMEASDKAMESLDAQINDLQIKQNALVDACNKVAEQLSSYLFNNIWTSLDNNYKVLHKWENFNKPLTSNGNLIEWKKTRREEKKRLEDKEALDLKLRNDAYIKFLELKDQDVQDVSHQGGHKVYYNFDEENMKLQIALILAYGSEHLKTSMANALPLNTWLDVEKIRDLIIDELAEGRRHEKKKTTGQQRLRTVIVEQN